MTKRLPRDFEHPEQPDTPQDGETEGRHHVLVGQDKLEYAAEHHEEVEPVEQRDEVTLKKNETD